MDIAAAVGAGLTFADDLFKYFAVDPDGFSRMSVERKLEALHEASTRALQARDLDAVDRCLAEYRRLQVQTA